MDPKGKYEKPRLQDNLEAGGGNPCRFASWGCGPCPSCMRHVRCLCEKYLAEKHPLRRGAV